MKRGIRPKRGEKERGKEYGWYSKGLANREGEVGKRERKGQGKNQRKREGDNTL